MKKYQIFTKQEKWSIVKRVEESSNKERELAKLGISKSAYYDWKRNNCETFVLNFSDESSYFALESRVYGHRANNSDIIKGLKNIKLTYGRYPKKIRLDCDPIP